MASPTGAQTTRRALIVASHPESLVKFRGELLRELLAHGVQVHAASPDLPANSEPARKLTSWGVTTHEISLARTGLNPLRDLTTVMELYRLLHRVQPSHLLAYTVKPVIYTMLAARIAQVHETTALITGLGYAFAGDGDSLKRSSVQLLVRALYRTALRRVRRVVFQNPDDQELFVRLGLVTPAQCGLVDGSGVHLEQYPQTELPPLEGTIHFVLIARLIRDKGICEFVEAGRRVRTLFPHLQLHLVGGLDTNPTAISRAELDGWIADGSVVYHGQVADVRPVLARSHVFVLPTFYREGVPRTILEAMAMGRPIITCDAPGCRETVEHGKNGYLVPLRDVSALADAMRRFLVEPTRIVQMGEASRELAVRKYDVRKVNRQMLRHMGLDVGGVQPDAPGARARA